MPIFFQRPENALKRANEFIDVGKKQRALDALYDVIKSKKHRQWSKTHEAIMEKYLQLCVELKKSHVAKEGLYQYKNISQQVSIKSLEDVVRKYLALAEEKTESARKESHQTVVDVDDLDVIQTPEGLLLSAVSGEDTQDRTDRAILTPWVKFLWESYRQCLDLLRNDAGVEKLYQDIAQQAFKFCLKYARKTEFRKLCDNLRTHLSHIHKHQHKQRAINLNNPESQQLHLETRLVQLDSAIQMELWMEAFKAVEDIHGLIQQSKKSPKPSLMANYYNKLGLVFWKSGNHMFHACAWHRMYHLIKEQKKNLSAEELSKNSSRVLIATLAIPIPASRNHIDARMEMDESTLDKQRRLANLLGLKNPPTRASLIKDLVKFGIPQQCYEDLKPLYQSLEVEFHPLKLADRVAKPLEFIANHKDLKQYVSSIQDITITRLIKQISQVYQSIEFGRLCNLAPFTTPFRLESVVVSAAKNLELQVKIDHHTRSLSFGTDLCVAQKEDVPEGPYLQSMPSEQIRNQLTAMANSLSKAYKIIQPVDVKKTELQAHICQTYRQVARKEHERILQRRIIIENRKEELENLSNKREQEEAQLVEEERRRQYDAEMTRLEKEADERERQRRKAEHYEVQKKVAKERLEQLLSTELGKNAFEGMTEDDIVKMDVDDILAKQVEQLEKEKKEMQEKLKGQEKKIDHYERAKRQEEIPLLEEQFQQEKENEREIWVKMEDERIKTMKSERELALKHKDRMLRMMEDRDVFVKQLADGRKSVFKEKVQDFEKKLKEEKKRRLEERKQKRKEDRRMKWIKDREEEEQRKKDEEAKRLREEEERAAQEKKEQEEAEYEERIQKLAEIEERKRAKEREIEEKEKHDKEEQRRKLREMDVRESGIRREDRSDWRRAGGGEDQSPSEKWKPSGGGGWRDREREKEKSWGKEGGGGGGGGWREREREREADGPREDRRDERRDQEWSRDRRDGPGPRDRDIRRDRDMDDRRDERRDGPRDGPSRDEPRREPDDWRRGGDSGGRDNRDWKKDDRPPARDDWRGGEKRGGGSDRRDDFQRGERKEEGGAWRSSRDAGRDSDRGGWRDKVASRDDHSGPTRDDRGGGPSRDERGGGWRGDDIRGPPRERRDERRDDREGGGGGPSWRRPAGGDERTKADEGAWRKAPAKKFEEEEERRPAPPRPREERPPPPKKEEVEGDGWTTVKRQ